MAGTILDIFKQDMFSVIHLTDGIQKLKFQPGRIGQMGLFSETGVATIDIAHEERDGLLQLIPPTARGGPGTTLPKIGRMARVIRAPHFQIDDAIMAEEVQGVRAWGSENAVEMVMEKVAERQQLHGTSLEATMEYARIGAIKGIVTYADGTSLDLFQFFQISAPPQIDFDLDNTTPTAGALRRLCSGMFRRMGDALGGIPFSGINAVCGDAFFDDLLSHVEVRTSYLNTPAASTLRESYTIANGLIYGSYPFGGIVFENYRGGVGSTAFIDPNLAHFFPTGVPNLFRTYLAPADYIETVNRTGQRLYSKVYTMENDKGVNMETQGNWLNICTRPVCLFTGKRT